MTALGLSVGFLWTSGYNLLVREPARALIADFPRSVTLTVHNFPKATSHGASFTALLQEEGFPSAKIQMYADADTLRFYPGDVIAGPVRLTASDFFRGESVDYYQARGIFLLGYARGKLSLVERPASLPLYYFPLYAAQALKSAISRVFPADVSGFERALITGDKSALPTGLYAAFQRSGISHVVAVSGLHISFLVGILLLLLGRRSRFSTAAGILLMFFFAAATGGSSSALRAAFMSALLLLAPLVHREPDKPTILAATLLLLLLPCPYAAASLSLQLSSGAVAGIYWATDGLISQWRDCLPKWSGFPGLLCQKVLDLLACNLALTFGALLITAPLSALYFGSIPLAGPLTNLLTLWAVSVSFIGGLLAVLLGIFSVPMGSALGWLISWPARWILLVAKTISRLPFSSVPLLSGHFALGAAVAYGILLLWLFGRKRVRPLIPAAALGLTLSAAFFVGLYPKLSGSLTVAALDVGEGSSTLLYSRGHAVLVDCGGNSADDPGDIAADYLQSLGLSRLDALILTHYHTDHANGVPELLARVDVPLLLLPDVTPEDRLRKDILAQAKHSGSKVIFLSDDFTFSSGMVDLTLYAPLGDGGANEEGLSLLCTSNGFEILITGDMNYVVERRLVKHKALPDIDLLVAGHHGSKTSTSEELLLTVKPDLAVISSGYNSYGHPAPETLERLLSVGCEVYLTDRMGTVTFTRK